MTEAKVAEGATVYGLGVVDGVVKLLGGGEARGANFDGAAGLGEEKTAEGLENVGGAAVERYDAAGSVWAGQLGLEGAGWGEG